MDMRQNMQYNTTNPLRLVTLFSGYDSQAIAMERLKDTLPGFDFNLVAWCEIDTYAIEAHNAIFPQWKDRNLGDITTVNPNDVPDCDLITWSFPCQAISTAGKQGGLKEGSGTTSSLAWECIKIFKAKRPKFLLMENVAAIMQDKFKADFTALRNAIEELGYANFIQIINASDMGVPQNRKRCFMVSILTTEEDPTPMYYFPKPIILERRLKDVLEKEVDESYYLSDSKIQDIINHCNRKQSKRTLTEDEINEMDSYLDNMTDGDEE